jgi:hypothetical protein
MRGASGKKKRPAPDVARIPGVAICGTLSRKLPAIPVKKRKHFLRKARLLVDARPQARENPGGHYRCIYAVDG